MSSTIALLFVVAYLAIGGIHAQRIPRDPGDLFHDFIWVGLWPLMWCCVAVYLITSRDEKDGPL